MGYRYDPAGTAPPYENYGWARCTVTDLPPEDDDTKVVNIALPLIPDFRRSGMVIEPIEVFDRDGNTITLDVTAVAVAVPPSGPAPYAGLLDGSGSTGPIVGWKWTAMLNGAVIGNGPTQEITIQPAGSYDYELEVEGIDGRKDTTTVTVTVS